MPSRSIARRALPLLLAGMVLLAAAAGASAPREPMAVYPLDELRPGQTGEAWSVFSGDSISRFDVEIIDRIPGQAPYDLVLVRCLGEELERSGVSQGMSGSPVYLDGRWLGAIAFNYSYSREPLAMVTPAEAMLALANQPAGERADAGATLRELPFLADDWTPALARNDDPPLAISVGGLAPAALDAMARDYRATGLRLQPMGRAAGGADADDGPETLEAGSAVAVELLRGPISAAAIGTVTRRDGDGIWAFGHPFLGEGPVSLPMASARIHAVMPSLVNSFKLGSVGRTLGAITRDGQAGIYGQLGEAPAMLPLTVSLSPAGEAPLTAEFALARHRRLMPMLARMAVDGWLPRRLGPGERGGIDARLRIVPAEGSGEPVELHSRFAGAGSGRAPAGWLQSILNVLQNGPAGPLPLQVIELELSWRQGDEPLRLDDLEIVRPGIRAGETWLLRARLRRGEEPPYTRDLSFPTGGQGLEGLTGGGSVPPGKYRLHVADGASFDRWNATRQPGLYRFETHGELLALLGRLESSGDLLIWLEGPGRADVAGGREFDLPTYFRELTPSSRKANLGAPKKPRRLLALRREAVGADGAAVGHHFLPVTVLEHPRRSKP